MEPSYLPEIDNGLRARIDAYHEAALAYAAVKLTLPETMGSQSWTADRLAATLGLSAPHLERMLRGLVTLGLAETRGARTDDTKRTDGTKRTDDTYVLTEAGQALAPGSPSNLRQKLLIVIEQYWQPWAHLAASVETGRPAFEQVFRRNVHDWRHANAEPGNAFDDYVARETLATAAPVLEKLPMTGVRTVADLGGGHGGLLAAVLAKHPSLEGVLVTHPHASEGARRFLKSAGVAARVSLLENDIGKTVVGKPVPADLYLLHAVLQHYDDTRARTILENCRAALKPGARLAVIERLMPDRATDDPAAIMLDLHMMTITGGRTRTRPELEALLDAAKLTAASRAGTGDGVVVIEATAD